MPMSSAMVSLVVAELREAKQAAMSLSCATFDDLLPTHLLFSGIEGPELESVRERGSFHHGNHYEQEKGPDCRGQPSIQVVREGRAQRLTSRPSQRWRGKVGGGRATKPSSRSMACSSSSFFVDLSVLMLRSLRV